MRSALGLWFSDLILYFLIFNIERSLKFWLINKQQLKNIKFRHVFI